MDFKCQILINTLCFDLNLNLFYINVHIRNIILRFPNLPDFSVVNEDLLGYQRTFAVERLHNIFSGMVEKTFCHKVLETVT